MVAPARRASNRKEQLMDQPRVFIVHLRRPRSASVNPNEMRSDPFWEFGSFGCTGCHSKNLLSVRNAPKLEGHRLAFAQGGRAGFRLVFLTPVVHVKKLGNRFEILWSPASMPFKYISAPILVANDGRSDIPLLKDMVSKAHRGTLEGAFSSCFRSRALPLVASIADQLVEAYERARSATNAGIAECYSEALPYPPPVIDKRRESTYKMQVEKTKPESSSCVSSGCEKTVRRKRTGGCC